MFSFYVSLSANYCLSNIPFYILDASNNIDKALSEHSNWHGAVSTSTDTLVPIERRPNTNGEEVSSSPAKAEVDVADSFHTPEKLSTSADREELGLSSPYVLLKQEVIY